MLQVSGNCNKEIDTRIRKSSTVLLELYRSVVTIAELTIRR